MDFFFTNRLVLGMDVFSLFKVWRFHRDVQDFRVSRWKLRVGVTVFRLRWESGVLGECRRLTGRKLVEAACRRLGLHVFRNSIY
jgi:hypothetical protein